MSINKVAIQWVSLKTIIGDQLHSIFRKPTRTIMPPAITMTLYFLIFGSLIGSQLREIAGYSYVQYITPGLIIMTAITSSYTHVVFSIFISKFNNSIEEVLISPAWNVTLLLGYVVGGIIRGLITSSIVLVVSLFFTRLSVSHIFLALFIILLTTILMSLVAFINGIYAKTFDDINVVPLFVLTPLTYLGGVFFSIEMLPGVWQTAAQFNPFLYVINAFRYSFLGVSDVGIWTAFSCIIVVVMLLFSFSLYTLHKGWCLRT